MSGLLESAAASVAPGVAGETLMELDDLVKVADLVGHADTRTTQGYRHAVRPSLPHAIEAWDRLLGRAGAAGVCASRGPLGLGSQ